MDANSIELKGSVISSINQEGSTVRIRFEPAYIVRTMTGSKERTRWQQTGDLVFDGVTRCDNCSPSLPANCGGGDVTENIYTYRDMVPVPLASRGHAGCDLLIDGSEKHLHIEAGAVTLEMEDIPKYIEHLR